MRLSLRLSGALVLAVATVSLISAFFQTRAAKEGLERELQGQAMVLAESLAKSALPLVDENSSAALQRFVGQFKDREALVGVAVYDGRKKRMAVTPGMAVDGEALAGIARAADQGQASSGFRGEGRSRVHVVILPLRTEKDLIGSLALIHDTAAIDTEGAAIWQRALVRVAIETFLILGITLLTIRWGVSRPLHNMAGWLRELRIGASSEPPAIPKEKDFETLSREARRLASSLTVARASAEEEARLRDTADSSWTAERLRVFAQSKLAGGRLFAVSNREPYEHNHRQSGVEWSVPPSGLVTALEPILRACGGTWIAQATGDADRSVVDENDRVRVPPDHPQYTLRRVWLSKEEEDGFYLGFANEGLWPLCHIAHTRPAFRAQDWEQYQAVNQKFTDALLEEMKDEVNPIVLVQDYHFALLPRLVKDQRPDARVAIFWHIPWPNPEAFGICPWQKELLDGLLGADLIGFHIQAHCNNFLDTVDRALESRIERERFAVTRKGRLTLVRPFPISVALDGPQEARPSNERHVSRVGLLSNLGVRASFMGVGVDRVDYTKGIPERLGAIERFLEQNPGYKEEFTFVQIGSPSRTTIPRYGELLADIEREVARINKRFQTSGWKPIVFLNRRHSHEEIQPYYLAADLCLVTSLHDGMNLVAKEFAAARADGQGVLILSRFTGASHELTDALVVNPYDTEELAGAIRRALEMPPHERSARMQGIRTVLREHNIYRWAGNLIGVLCEIRTAEMPALAAVAQLSA